MRQKIRTDYKICPLCGAALDVGEACDCLQEKLAAERPQKARNGAKPYKHPQTHKSALKRPVRA